MRKQGKQTGKGLLLGLLSGVFWGACSVLSEYFFRSYAVDSGWITTMRLLFGGLFVLLFAIKQNPRGLWKIWLDQRRLPHFFAYSILGLFSVQFFFYVAVQESNAATAAVLQFTAPVFILLYTLVWRRQPVPFLSFVYVLLALLGVGLLVTEGDLSQLSISNLALVAGFVSAIAIVFTTNLPSYFVRQYGSLYTLGWGMVLAGGVSNLRYPLWEPGFALDGTSLGISAVIAFFGTALAFLCMMWALHYISPLMVSVLGATEPLTSILFSSLFFGLEFSFSFLLASLLIIPSMVLLSLREGG